MEEDIKILEEFIENYKEVQEKYKDDEIQAEIERSCYFEEVPAKAIEHLLQAYKEQEKVIDEMAEYIEDFTGSCPNDMYDWQEIDCEKECEESMKKCWKQYFINKVKENKDEK